MHVNVSTVQNVCIVYWPMRIFCFYRQLILFIVVTLWRHFPWDGVAGSGTLIHVLVSCNLRFLLRVVFPSFTGIAKSLERLSTFRKPNVLVINKLHV